MRKHVLITGGMGFIGHHVAAKLQTIGWKISIIDLVQMGSLIEQRMDHVKAKKIDYHNIVDRDSMELYMMKNKITHILHLANHANQAQVAADPVGAVNSIVNSTAHMADIAKKHGCKFVYLSSSMVYGDFKFIPAPEEHPLNPVNLYGILKKQAEEIISEFLRGTDYTIIRPSAVYGPRDNFRRVINKWCFAALKNDPIEVNNPAELLDFTFVDDLADGIALAVDEEKTHGTIYNMTAESSRSLGEVAQMIRYMSGSKSKIVIRPANAEMPARGALNSSDARHHLKWKPVTDLETGIEKTIDWMRPWAENNVSI